MEWPAHLPIVGSGGVTVRFYNIINIRSELVFNYKFVKLFGKQS